MRLFGFVREQRGKALTPPPPNTRCEIRVRWSRGSRQTTIPLLLDGPTALDPTDPTLSGLAGGGESVVPLPAPSVSSGGLPSDSLAAAAARAAAMGDAAMGSFSAELRVPAAADYGTHPISFSCRLGSGAGSGMHNLGSATVAIADPRPPSVSLDAKLPSEAFLRPGGRAELEVVAASLTGVPVGGAEVKLRWSLHRTGRRGDAGTGIDHTLDESGEESGEESVVTGPNGIGSISWRPANLSAAEVVGDSISLDLEWVGPTRERLTKSLSLPVAISEISISIEAPSQVWP